MHKLYIFLWVSIFCLGIANALPAQGILDSTINENISHTPLIQFFTKLEQTYSVRFFYLKNWIDKIEIVETCTTCTIKNIIETTLAQNQLSHIVIKGNSIILIPDDYTYFMHGAGVEYVKQIGNPLEKGKFALNQIKGFVYFGKTGEPIAGVLVTDTKSHKQTITDYSGHYSIKIPGGRTQLQYSFMGLETREIEVEIMSNGKLDAELMELPIAIDAVNILASGGKNNLERTQMGMLHMDVKSMSRLPVLMGEADIIKSMALLPGVSSMGELSTGYNVRGGNVDQNLMLINDVPIYGTSHLFGMFSTLIPNAISSVDLYKGTQPANFGSKVSSVMDIKLKTPDSKKIKGNVGLGILNSSVFIEGPLIDPKISFFLGARTTYSNWLLKKIPDINIRNSKANFNDFIGKLDYRLNRNNNISIFGYLSNDNFTYSHLNNYSYGSAIAGLNYNYYYNNTLLFHSTFSITNYHSSFGYFENAESAYNIFTGLWQWHSKMECNWTHEKNELAVGIEGNAYNIEPGSKKKYDSTSDIVASNIENEKAFETAMFINNNFRWNKNISFMAGLRYSWFSKTGPSNTLQYQPFQPKNNTTQLEYVYHNRGDFIKPYFGLEPRFGIKTLINETSSLKLGYNITRQYLHLISNMNATTPSDFWKAADKNIKPIYNQLFSVGFFKNLLGNILETSVEAYFKLTNNSLDYKNGAVLIMNPAIEQAIVPVDVQSYGLEFMLRKNTGNFTGWMSYTLSKSQSKTKSIFSEETLNNGNYYPSINNRLHDLTLSASYQLSLRWSMSSNFIFTSGRPVTLPEQKYNYYGNDLVYYSERNKYRMPAYHRLDFSIRYEGFLKKTQKIHPSFVFSVYNVYGHKNIYSVYYKQSEPSANNNYQNFSLYQLSIIGVPVPSLTLNLNF